MRRAPLPAYRSLSAIPFACRFRLPLLTPGPLPLAPSPFYSLPFTFTLRPRPVSRFQPSAGSPPFGQRRAPARARRPGATPPVPDMMRAGRAHSAHSRIRARRAPSECRAITRANMEEFAMRCSPTAPARNRSCQARARDVRPGRRLRVPRDRAYARLCTRRHAIAQETHQKGSPMHESKHSMPAWPGGGTTATTRPARQASAAASTRRRHAARPRRRQAACRRQRAMTSPACASPAARRPIRREHQRGLQHRDANAHRHGRIEACFIGARLGSRMPPPRGRTGPRPRQSAGVGRSCASLAASSPSPSLSSSASRRAGSPLVSRSVRARSASSR